MRPTIENTEQHTAHEEAATPIEKKRSLAGVFVSEAARSFKGALLTSASITTGAATGIMHAGLFGAIAQGLSSAAGADNGSSFGFALGLAFNAPFLHHMSRGAFAERLCGNPEPKGAFIKAAKATSYTAGAIGAAVATAIALSASPEVDETQPQLQLQGGKTYTVKYEGKSAPLLQFA